MDQTILPFCTSHSSGIGLSADNLHDLCSDTVNWMDGQRFGSGTGEDEYATVMQQFSADRFLGNQVRFAAFVKAQDVDGWAGLWMRLDGRFGVTLKLDNMQNRPIRGTSERLCDRI